MKIANIITLSRVVYAAAMIFSEPLSVAFWVFYILCGVSDIIDGPVARALHQQSDSGAKLDSLADLTVAAAIFIIAIKSAAFPAWLWMCVASVALVKIACYFIGLYKYGTFAGLHTIMNKAAGALIFAFLPLCAVMGFATSGIIVCGVAFLASVEELVITLRSKDLNRDRRSFLG